MPTPGSGHSASPWLAVARIIAANPRTALLRTEDWTPVRKIIASWSATSPQTSVQSWDPVAQMIKNAQASQGFDRRELQKLLEKSNQLLFPLDDPFSTDFGLHRWLRGNREEVYSDWLAWIMEELDNAADIFWLLDLDVPPESGRWRNTAAQREAPIQNGRLDIVLRWPGKALLVIEVKVTDERSASTAKQARYRKWMDKHGEPYGCAVLLAVDAEPGISKGGFRRLDWRIVCIRMRCIARKLLTRTKGQPGTRNGNVVRAALVLGFAGAVEQNLLDMPGRPLQLMNEGHLLNVFPVQKYLSEFHGSEQR